MGSLTAASFFKDQVKKIRLDFLTTILLLQAIGLLSLYSAAHGAYSSNSHLFYRQLIWISAGWGIFFAASFLRHQVFLKFHWALYITHVFLLILTLAQGGKVSRWLSLGWVQYQPSETLKLALILTFACYLSQRRRFRKPLRGLELVWCLMLAALPLALVVRQPDLGTAGLSFLIAGSVILFNGIQKKALLAALALFAVSLPLSWSFLKDYQKKPDHQLYQPQKRFPRHGIQCDSI